jgi:hypothetical protein
MGCEPTLRSTSIEALDRRVSEAALRRGTARRASPPQRNRATRYMIFERAASPE